MATDKEGLHQILRLALHPAGELQSAKTAELMILLGAREEALQLLRPYSEGEISPFRIVTWRALARGEESAAVRDKSCQRIRQVLLDESSPFRVHAQESLAKLEAPLQPEEALFIERSLSSSLESDAPFALWRVAQSGNRDAALTRLTELLDSTDEIARHRAAYVLWNLSTVPLATRTMLLRLAHDGTQPVGMRVVAALAAEDPQAWDLAHTAESPGSRTFVALSLAGRKDEESRRKLNLFIRDAAPDVRAAAAYGLLLPEAG
ncbi:hypothetical protein [Planctomicrobium sp. SH664]|uniref:hypothetical protein n=1 Tax=Planctomicrobium sp. SH664 TaxID=3448125 RepID=UPI003F5C8E90